MGDTRGPDSQPYTELYPTTVERIEELEQIHYIVTLYHKRTKYTFHLFRILDSKKKRLQHGLVEPKPPTGRAAEFWKKAEKVLEDSGKLDE